MKFTGEERGPFSVLIVIDIFYCSLACNLLPKASNALKITKPRNVINHSIHPVDVYTAAATKRLTVKTVPDSQKQNTKKCKNLKASNSKNIVNVNSNRERLKIPRKSFMMNW